MMVRLAEYLLANEEQAHKINKSLTDSVEITPLDIPPELMVKLYCECGDDECREHVQLTLEQYREAHKGKHTFVVKPNHYFPRFERVVKKLMNFWIVQKREDRLKAP